MTDWQSCAHHSGKHRGRLLCLLCGARYLIDIGGARWIAPFPHWRRRAPA
jgi:hypothetical protein